MPGQSKFECLELCPLKDIIGFEALRKQCRGPRVRLDESELAYDKDKKMVTEVASMACGSRLSSDKNLPTISMEDWANANTLTIQEIAELHRQGRFN